MDTSYKTLGKLTLYQSPVSRRDIRVLHYNKTYYIAFERFYLDPESKVWIQAKATNHLPIDYLNEVFDRKQQIFNFINSVCDGTRMGAIHQSSGEHHTGGAGSSHSESIGLSIASSHTKSTHSSSNSTHSSSNSTHSSSNSTHSTSKSTHSSSNSTHSTSNSTPDINYTSVWKRSHHKTKRVKCGKTKGSCKKIRFEETEEDKHRGRPRKDGFTDHLPKKHRTFIRRWTENALQGIICEPGYYSIRSEILDMPNKLITYDPYLIDTIIPLDLTDSLPPIELQYNPSYKSHRHHITGINIDKQGIISFIFHDFE